MVVLHKVNKTMIFLVAVIFSFSTAIQKERRVKTMEKHEKSCLFYTLSLFSTAACLHALLNTPVGMHKKVMVVLFRLSLH